MSLPKYRARRDTGESDIVDALNVCGWDCVRLSSGELPDLLCRHRATGRYELLEVESGHYKRRRTKEQLDMLKAWRIPVVKTLEQALAAVGAKIT